MSETLLNYLSEHETWQAFYDHKKEKGHLIKKEDKELKQFIDSQSYLPIAQKILKDGFYFNAPELKIINKVGTDKKREVYCFGQDETYVLKVLAFLLYKYDDFFSANLFSFRKDFGVKRAIQTLIKQVEGKQLYCYKLDIKNYFNSISVSLLLPKLKTMFEGDEELYSFFESMLGQVDGAGVMAGTPTSPFLSNVYLTGLDKRFYELGISYCRYSDDIIVFAETLDELNNHRDFIHDFLTKLHLQVNAKKEQILTPNQAWSFLGVEYLDGKVDLSQVTIEKIKGKIRRKARAIYRWKNKKGAPDDKALLVMVRVFNKKFFGDKKSKEDGKEAFDGTKDLTWSRWFFPMLTTDKGLHQVDNYLQMWLRYVVTGKHNKVNHEKASYEMLKGVGYKSLVNEYHKVGSTFCSVKK